MFRGILGAHPGLLMLRLRDAGVCSEQGSDPKLDQTGPQVWSGSGSGLGFALGQTCSGLGQNWTTPQTLHLN
jgi:hypothetical protein